MLGDLHGGCQYIRRSGLAAYYLQQAHNIGWTEEVQTDHVLRTGDGGRNGVDIE
ncbi:hypothetical protein D3C85_1416910 [compost metagenome]